MIDVSKLPKEGSIVGGLYRLVRLLGQGTFGKVFVAERIDVPEHRVALKLTLREAYSGRDVERELVMLAAAGHPHMVQLKDHGVTADYVWFTMPVYDGETLSARLRRGTLSLSEAHEVFVPIARSLEALHRAGLRHQDLKPDNVFLAHFGGRIHPIILDLGVAAERTSKFVAGTILFAAPEQTALLTGNQIDTPLNEKMDTYGLAATLLFSLVGMANFPGSNAGTNEELEQAQIQRASNPLNPNVLPELSGRPRIMLEEAFRSWFAVDPETRPTMGQMALALDILLEKEREEKIAEQRARAKQRGNLLRMRLAVAFLVVITLAFVGFAFAKRETIQLAAELQQARAGEKQSFDNLQSCEDAQNKTQSRLDLCETRSDKERTAFHERIEEITKNNERARDDINNQLANCSSRLRTSEDNADAFARACADAHERLNAEHAARVKTVTEERDTATLLNEDRKRQIDAMNTRLARSDAELAECKAETKRLDNPYAGSRSDNPYDDSDHRPGPQTFNRETPKLSH